MQQKVRSKNYPFPTKAIPQGEKNHLTWSLWSLWYHMISWYHDIIVTIPQEKHDQDKNCGRRTDDKFHFSSTFSPPCNERWSHRKFGGRLQYWLDHKSMKLNFQTWFPFHLPIVSNVKYLNPKTFPQFISKIWTFLAIWVPNSTYVSVAILLIH